MRLFPLFLLALITLLPFDSSAQTAPTFADCSIASLSGSSQALGTAFTLSSKAYNRKYLHICNTSTVIGDNLGVNLTGGTAVLQGAGTETLTPGQCLEFAAYSGSGLPLPPSNNINVIGTASQPALCEEGR